MLDDTAVALPPDGASYSEIIYENKEAVVHDTEVVEHEPAHDDEAADLKSDAD